LIIKILYRGHHISDDNALARDNSILAKFRAALNEMYGERIERVLLYGSRARGDASVDSDYDLAGFLKDLSDRWAEADKIAVTATDILRENRGGDTRHAVPGRRISGQHAVNA
jgi:uncharacterized protein